MKARGSRLAHWLRREPDPPAAPPLIGSAEPTIPHWAKVYEQTATVGVRVLAQSAPRTIRQFAVLAWRASPALTVVSLLLHALAAVATTSGFLLTDGRITEQGTHAELMAARGTYHELFTIQADSYAQAEAD